MYIFVQDSMQKTILIHISSWKWGQIWVKTFKNGNKTFKIGYKTYKKRTKLLNYEQHFYMGEKYCSNLKQKLIIRSKVTYEIKENFKIRNNISNIGIKEISKMEKTIFNIRNKTFEVRKLTSPLGTFKIGNKPSKFWAKLHNWGLKEHSLKN